MEALKNKEEAAQAVKRYTHILAELGVLVAQRDKALLIAQKAINEKHQPLITAKSDELTVIEARLKDWATDNRKAEFGEEKSLEFEYGWLKFREGNRQLFLLARWDWDKVLKTLLATPVTSEWQEYIRRDPEVNKQKLLEATKNGGNLPEVKLRDIGLRVDRDEKFSIKPKPEMIARDCDLMP